MLETKLQIGDRVRLTGTAVFLDEFPRVKALIMSVAERFPIDTEIKQIIRSKNDYAVGVNDAICWLSYFEYQKLA
jgi:hypothetical protein